MNDELGDYLKSFERASEVTLGSKLPMILRFDGRAFHSWTRQFERPFDTRLHGLMVKTMMTLAREANARYAYTQSDEITLVCLCEGEAQPLFGGRVQKLTSLLASLAGAYFNRVLAEDLDAIGGRYFKLATFDCRAYTVPDKGTAADVIMWREFDAIRNSTLGRGQEFLSSKKMHGMSQQDVRQWLRENGHAWGDLPPERKFGAAVQRRTTLRPYTTLEVLDLPEKHAAHKNPNLQVERKDYCPVRLPLRWLYTNQQEVIFDGVEGKLIDNDKRTEF